MYRSRYRRGLRERSRRRRVVSWMVNAIAILATYTVATTYLLTVAFPAA